jgi:Fe-S-cluster-containing dehydrogenase component
MPKKKISARERKTKDHCIGTGVCMACSLGLKQVKKVLLLPQTGRRKKNVVYQFRIDMNMK